MLWYQILVSLPLSHTSTVGQLQTWALAFWHGLIILSSLNVYLTNVLTSMFDYIGRYIGGWASNCIWKYYRNWLLIHALIPGILCWKETILTRWGLDNIDRLVQERRNSSALAMELRLSCTNPSSCSHTLYIRELILYENCILIQRSNLQYATRV